MPENIRKSLIAIKFPLDESGCINARQKSAKKIPWDGREYSLTISVPPLGMSVYRCVPTDTMTATVPSKRGSARTGKTVKKRK